MKAAFLVRCSTDKQDYDRQLSDLHKVAKSLDFSVDSKYIFGEYITGKDDTTLGDRISIKKLREAAENKLFDVVLINEVSRLSRDSVSGRVYVRQFNNLGIPLYFRDRRKWTININSGEVDTSFEKELGSYFDGAAEYLKSLKTQTASGRRKRLEDNQMVQGKPAFGYKKLGGSDKRTKNTVVIDSTASQIVIYAYNKYLEEGSTLKSTAISISNKYGGKFATGKVNHILNYSGYYTGQTTVNVKDPDAVNSEPEPFIITFEPIIEEELFKAAQLKLRSNRASKTSHNAKHKIHLLSRLIKCSFCNHSFTPRKRTDGRAAYNWICMSKINNSADCHSNININGDKVDDIIWSFIKKELLVYTNINDEERTLRIDNETNKINNYKEDIENLINNIEGYKKIQERAYNAYLNAPDELSDDALKRYNHTLVNSQKEIDYLSNRVSLLKQSIADANNRILRYSNDDYTEDYISQIESDFNKKRLLFLEYIKAIYPYKVDYRIVILEVHTIDGIFNILLNANMKKNKEVYYIDYMYAKWQNSINKLDAFEAGNYFVVSNASLVMETDNLEEFVTYNKLVEICKLNDWIIEYEI